MTDGHDSISDRITASEQERLQDLAAHTTVTNDAVAGEPVVPTGHYAGPEGSEPLEAEPETAGNDLEGEPIDLADEA